MKLFGGGTFVCNMRQNDITLLMIIIAHIMLAVYVVYRAETTIDENLRSNYEFKQLYGSHVNITNVRHTLRKITSFDSRMFPSENNKNCTNYLLEEIHQIIANTSKNSFFSTNVELFTSNGSCIVDIITRRSYMNYRLVPNIVVTMKPKNYNSLDNYCLISSHYDSVEGSPGASDNALFSSILLEIISYYSRFDIDNTRKLTPYCNLLFVFNGAEEAAMIAANEYITKHYLRNNISLLINLDSAGGDGRGFLFQTTHGASHLLKAYKHYVPYPIGNSYFEEVFNSGIIPADTDFKIYRNFGKLNGLDIAIAGNGHQYHNQNDFESIISNVTIARETINLCSLIYGLINEPSIGDLNNPTHNVRYVYFDYLGKYMVVYSQNVAYFMNFLLILGVFPLMLSDLQYVTKRSVNDCLMSLGVCIAAHILSFISALFGNAFLAWCMNITGHLLSYNVYPITGVLLYGIPAQCVYISMFYYLLNYTFQKYISYDPKLKHIFIYWSFICIDSCISIVGTFLFDLRLTYIQLFSVISLVPICLISRGSWCNYSNSKLYNIFYYILYTSCTFFWTTYKIYILYLSYGIMFSFFDRTPCSFPSEYIVSLLITLSVLPIFNSINALIIPIEKIKKMFTLSISILWFIILFVIFFTSLSPPYKPIIGSKRLTAHHMIHSQYSENMSLINKSAKMVIMATDHNCLLGYGEKLIERLKPLSIVDPFWHSINAFALIPQFKTSFFYYDTNIPNLNDDDGDRIKLSLNLKEIETISHRKKRYYFNLYCEQATITDIVIPNSMVLKQWSFIQPTIPNGISTDGQKIYNHIHFIPDPQNPINFWLEIEMDNNYDLKDKSRTLYSSNYGTKFHIIVVTHYMGTNNKATDEINSLKQMLPIYVAPVTNIVKRLDYVFDFNLEINGIFNR